LNKYKSHSFQNYVNQTICASFFDSRPEILKNQHLPVFIPFCTFGKAKYQSMAQEEPKNVWSYVMVFTLVLLAIIFLVIRYLRLVHDF